MRTTFFQTIDNPCDFKRQLLLWSKQFREIVFLDSNKYPDQYSSYECMLAVDAFTSVQTDSHNAFEDLKNYQQTTRDWLFGYLSYDLKNDTEVLSSQNFDGLDFPDLYFFQPKKIFLLKNNQLEIHYLKMCDDEMQQDLESIRQQGHDSVELHSKIKIQQRVSNEDYVAKVNIVLEHIHRGDCYEANFCMEFFADGTIDPYDTFKRLNAISQPPFATFFKSNYHYLLSASPERYLRKEGETIISQPIKGTSKRLADPAADEISKQALRTDPKERSENIMIVDLVRNDLSKTAQKDSVEVRELCEIHSFLQVHQMISTVVSKMDNAYTALDVIKSTFPMGSMTGAPKISAMKIIEALEVTKRGLYSGAVGYFTPAGDFDFNVVIRSILYNAKKEYISFSVGSAITSQSVPEMEYEECLLKARAMFDVLDS